MRIGMKLVIGFTVVVGLIISTTLFSLYTYHGIYDDVEALKVDIVPGVIGMMEMESIAIGAHRHLMEFLMHNTEEEEEETWSHVKELRLVALEHLEHETRLGEEAKDLANQRWTAHNGTHSSSLGAASEMNLKASLIIRANFGNSLPK